MASFKGRTLISSTSLFHAGSIPPRSRDRPDLDLERIVWRASCDFGGGRIGERSRREDVGCLEDAVAGVSDEAAVARPLAAEPSDVFEDNFSDVFEVDFSDVFEVDFSDVFEVDFSDAAEVGFLAADFSGAFDEPDDDVFEIAETCLRGAGGNVGATGACGGVMSCESSSFEPISISSAPSSKWTAKTSSGAEVDAEGVSAEVERMEADDVSPAGSPLFLIARA